MEHHSEISIILKNISYQERDRVVVFLTENQGKVTGIAKGGISSRRFGGSLNFLSCSRVQFVQKPHAELARIESATIHHEFKQLPFDFHAFTAASFAAEVCLRALEPHCSVREVFLVLSHFLVQLNQGLSLHLAVNAFLAKFLHTLGYSPRNTLNATLYPQFSKILSTPFQQLQQSIDFSLDQHAQIYYMLSDFLHHHMPGVPASGLSSWKLFNESMMHSFSGGHMPLQPPQINPERLR